MTLKIYFEDELREITDTAAFFKQYRNITAGGGVVQRKDGKILLIFRRGKWDLPKGKKEDNESIEVCAEREIMEETGLHQLALKKKLITTYHTYQEKGIDIVKDTHWFLFEAPGKQALHPQTEEDITRIEWVDKNGLGQFTSNTYQLIREVLQSAGLSV